MRRRITAAMIAVVALAGVAGTAVEAQQGLVVVVHASNDVRSVSAGELRSIFLGRTRFWSPGVAVHAYARPPATPAGRGLLRVLGMAPARYRHHWQVLQLSGRGTAPREVASPARAAAYVAADRGAITVMTADEARRLPPGLRAIPLR